MPKLILGLVAFFGVHSISLLALDWRNRAAERLGTRAWQALYSIASFVGIYLLVSGYSAARRSAAVLYVPPSWTRYLAALLMLPVFVLALASVLPGRIRVRSRHPLLIATMLWAVAHLLTNGGVADLLLFGTFLAWAVVVRLSLDRRPSRPKFKLSASTANDAIAVAGGLALYAIFVLWLHVRWFGVPVLAVSW